MQTHLESSGLKHLWYLPLSFITFYLEREHTADHRWTERGDGMKSGLQTD